MDVGYLNIRHRGRLFEIFLDSGYAEDAYVIKGKPLKIASPGADNHNSDSRRFWKLFYRLKEEEMKSMRR